MRGGGAEQGPEGVDGGDGARRHDAVERVLSVSGSQGAGSGYER